MLKPFVACDIVPARLQEIGARDLAPHGYGVKSFTQAMIETAT
jgi:hypothetical protein